METNTKITIAASVAFILIAVVIFFIGSSAGYDINTKKV